MIEPQKKSLEWSEQWELFKDDERFLFFDWIQPVQIDDFQGKEVLECGCGGGQHTAIMAEVAKFVTAVDLNTADLARKRCSNFENVDFIEADLNTMDLAREFDIVICIGVIHHTDNPDQVFHNLYRHLRPGGKLIIWTYSAEGNAMVRLVVEPIRKLFLRHLSRPALVIVSKIITAFLYAPVYSVYCISWMKWLPYYEYFRNFRRLSFDRNVLNVFDKLNAPQTRFTTLETCEDWMNDSRFEEGSTLIKPYLGVSWTLVGSKSL